MRILMKKAIPLLALLSFLCVATAPAAVIDFNPANPLNVVDLGGFTGSLTPDDPYAQVRVGFSFTGLNPSPLPASFTISNIVLKGNGIASSLSFSDITITGNGTVRTLFAELNSLVSNLDFSSSALSFSLPGGIINDGARLTVSIQYKDADDFQFNTSTGVVFEAVPEPSTYALLALAAVGLAAYRWRQRVKSVA
jgi:hypothetical protein